jgi:hypothetical protein
MSGNLEWLHVAEKNIDFGLFLEPYYIVVYRLSSSYYCLCYCSCVMSWNIKGGGGSWNLHCSLHALLRVPIPLTTCRVVLLKNISNNPSAHLVFTFPESLCFVTVAENCVVAAHSGNVYTLHFQILALCERADTSRTRRILSWASERF